jgi:hypothetical protein
MEGAIPLLPVDVEKVEATESRDDNRERSEEFEELYDEAIDERRESITCWNIRWINCGGCLWRSASTCRIDSSSIWKLSSIVAVVVVVIVIVIVMSR